MVTQIVKVILEAIKGNKTRKNKPQAEMYLPDYIMVLGVIMLIAAAGLGIAFVFVHAIWMIIVAVCLAVIGVAAFMCWKNQSIKVLSEEKFEYTTFLGNKYTYRFDEITSVRKNSDSTTVFIGKKKVHIEDCAIISRELVNYIYNKR